MYLPKLKRLTRYFQWEHLLLTLIIAAGLATILVIVLTDRVLYQGNSNDSYVYILPTIIQSLATILALLVTVSLLAGQLAARAYSPRVIKYRITDFWTWFAIFIYLLAIVWSAVVLSNLKQWSAANQQHSIDIALILSGMSLTFIAPFTLATIKGLRPDKIAEWLIQRGDYDSLDELIRKAVNDGLITVIDYSLTLLVIKGKTQLENSGGKVETAERLSSLLLSIGRHSYQRYNPDSVAQVMVRFTELVSYCNEYPRYWRNAADFFNEAAIELYAYSEEWIGRSK